MLFARKPEPGETCSWCGSPRHGAVCWAKRLRKSWAWSRGKQDEGKWHEESDAHPLCRLQGASTTTSALILLAVERLERFGCHVTWLQRVMPPQGDGLACRLARQRNRGTTRPCQVLQQSARAD